MKNKITLYLFLIVCLTSCTDEIKLSKDLDGTWSIESIESEIYTTTPNETKNFNNVGTLSFDHCSKSERSDNIGHCLGSYNITIDNETTQGTFSFFTDIAADNNTSESTEYEWVLISIDDNMSNISLNDLSLSGSWKIESLEKKSCTLAKLHPGGFQRMYLKK
jgi:hypothetical protein